MDLYGSKNLGGSLRCVSLGKVLIRRREERTLVC